LWRVTFERRRDAMGPRRRSRDVLPLFDSAAARRRRFSPSAAALGTRFFFSVELFLLFCPRHVFIFSLLRRATPFLPANQAGHERLAHERQRRARHAGLPHVYCPTATPRSSSPKERVRARAALWRGRPSSLAAHVHSVPRVVALSHRRRAPARARRKTLQRHRVVRRKKGPTRGRRGRRRRRALAPLALVTRHARAAPAAAQHTLVRRRERCPLAAHMGPDNRRAGNASVGREGGQTRRRGGYGRGVCNGSGCDVCPRAVTVSCRRPPARNASQRDSSAGASTALEGAGEGARRTKATPTTARGTGRRSGRGAGGRYRQWGRLPPASPAVADAAAPCRRPPRSLARFTSLRFSVWARFLHACLITRVSPAPTGPDDILEPLGHWLRDLDGVAAGDALGCRVEKGRGGRGECERGAWGGGGGTTSRLVKKTALRPKSTF